MGDLAFNIEKFVDLNKVVTLDIDKTVDVNVNNPDQLATAEADAEAFGEHALAETDAYTYVTPFEAFSYAESTAALDLEREPEECTCVWDGAFEAVGNIAPWFLAVDADGSIPDTLTLDFTGPGDGTIPPDVDDIDGFGDLVGLSSPPPSTPDVPMPDPVEGLFSVDDMVLQAVIPDAVPDPTDPQEYTLVEAVDISFGERTIDICTSEGGSGGAICPEPLTGELTVTVPEGTVFLVDFEAAGIGGIFEAAIIFEQFPGGGIDEAIFAIDGNPFANGTFQLASNTELDTNTGVELGTWGMDADIVMGV